MAVQTRSIIKVFLNILGISQRFYQRRLYSLKTINRKQLLFHIVIDLLETYLYNLNTSCIDLFTC